MAYSTTTSTQERTQDSSASACSWGGDLRTATAVTTILLFLLVFTDVAAAQSSGPVPQTDAGAAPGALPGRLEWGLLAGGALPVDVDGARSDRRLSLLAVEFGRIVSRPHGPGMLAGQFEIMMQAMPIAVRGPEDFWGLGLSPLFVRWNFTGTRRVRPFAEASAGLMLIDWDTSGPGRIARNFHEQAGLGLRIGSGSGRGLITGYRFQHISNGSPTLPSPAVDSHLVYVGFSMIR